MNIRWERLYYVGKWRISEKIINTAICFIYIFMYDNSHVISSRRKRVPDRLSFKAFLCSLNVYPWTLSGYHVVYIYRSILIQDVKRACGSVAQLSEHFASNQKGCEFYSSQWIMFWINAILLVYTFHVLWEN